MSVVDIDANKRAARILIIDDQAVNVKLLEKHLRHAGFENIIGVTDPRDVEGIYREKPVDLVLLDIRMPHLDGFQVMQLLQKLKGEEHLPILILTAQTDQETRDRALNEGATDFLHKPFDATEVLLRVKNMLDVRQLYQDKLHQNEILEVKVQERTLELKETIIEIVRRLGRAAEYRDNETGLHVVRMSKYSRLIAEQLGFSTEQAETMEYAAAMHDIGKIGTPDAILLKPGGLDDEEWSTMKEHTIVGGDILSESNHRLLQLAEQIALCHHEKWDGSGYPRQLKGEEIPLEARIVPVADVFDALTSVRPYKKAWPLEKALEEIRNCSGSHFDPQVVDAFFVCLSEILKIKEQFAEPVQSESEDEA